jgi:hypothetical protein
LPVVYSVIYFAHLHVLYLLFTQLFILHTYMYFACCLLSYLFCYTYLLCLLFTQLFIVHTYLLCPLFTQLFIVHTYLLCPLFTRLFILLRHIFDVSNETKRNTTKYSETKLHTLNIGNNRLKITEKICWLEVRPI